jgi:hypothetical protein
MGRDGKTCLHEITILLRNQLFPSLSLQLP